MHRFTPILISTCLLGCSPAPDAGQSATQPAAVDATRPAIKPIELHFGVYLARLDIRTTITSDGLLRSIRTENKSYGANDIDPKHERVEIREGRLSAEQIAELARLFANWDSLFPEPYGGVPDGGSVTVRYGDRIVSGGSGVPKQVWDAYTRVSEFTATMPIAK